MRFDIPLSRFGSLAAAFVLLPLLLAGCTSSPLDERQVTYAGWQQNTMPPQPRLGPVAVDHTVMFQPAQPEMSDIEREALGRFLTANGVASGQQVTLSVVVADGGRARLTADRLASTRAELARRGVVGSVQAADPVISGLTADEVRVTALKLAMLQIDCPGYNVPSQLDFEHRPLLNPGCANAVNLGLMVADPNDLAGGGPMSAADGEAATLAIQRYRTGQVYPSSDSQANVPFRGNVTN